MVRRSWYFAPTTRNLGSQHREKIPFILQRPVEWWSAPRDAILEAITRHFGELPIMVHNCDVKFRFCCPQLWDQLRPTDDERIRHCDVCAKSVHRAADANEADLLARRGKCVAYSYTEYSDTMGLIEFD